MKILVRDLAESFGRVRVIHGLDLDVASGDAVAVLGPSGCGKTTLLRLMAGLVSPDEGEIELNGRVVSRRGNVLAPHKRDIGYAFQRSALWPHMTVARNVAFGLHALPGDEARHRTQEWMRRVGLDGLADRYPDQLSGGQARRAGLARALAPEPAILLLDEPLTHLDADLRADLVEVIADHVGRTKATVVYVTHDAAEARSVTDRVLRMERGKLTDSTLGGKLSSNEQQRVQDG